MSTGAGVVLYTTSTATTLKLKHDVKRIKELLEAKKVDYEEVRAQSAALPSPSTASYYHEMRVNR